MLANVLSLDRFDFLNSLKIIMDRSDQKPLEFNVPKNLLVQRSRVFARRESEDSLNTPYKLPAIWEEDFSRYLQLLYTDQVLLFSHEDNPTAKQAWTAACDLLLLSQHFGDVKSENLVSDAIIRMLDGGLSCQAAAKLVRGSTPQKPRQILLDFVVEKLGAGDIPPDLHQSADGVALLHEAVTELSKRKQSGEQRPRQNTKEGMKRYHKSLE